MAQNLHNDPLGLMSGNKGGSAAANLVSFLTFCSTSSDSSATSTSENPSVQGSVPNHCNDSSGFAQQALKYIMEWEDLVYTGNLDRQRLDNQYTARLMETIRLVEGENQRLLTEIAELKQKTESLEEEHVNLEEQVLWLRRKERSRIELLDKKEARLYRKQQELIDDRENFEQEYETFEDEKENHEESRRLFAKEVEWLHKCINDVAVRERAVEEKEKAPSN